MKHKSSRIDPNKLRAGVHKLRAETVVGMLADAIELLPPAKLFNLAKKYLDVESLRPDTGPATPGKLLKDARCFRERSLAGEYYESFMVNSKNYLEKSAGTRAWIGEYDSLVDQCVTSARAGDPAKVREAMDILFGLLDHIDEGHDDIIFFADEGGSWQVGVDWAKVLPVWFKVLSATASPEEYAQRVMDVLSRHYSYGSDKMLAVARRTATPDQRKALAKVQGAQRSKCM